MIAVDIAKGAVASGVGALVAGPVGAHTAATASVVGHCLPVWNGGKGGKGVAPSVGQCLATFPAYFPIDLGIAAVTASNPRWKQRAFTATIVSSICWVLGGVLWWRDVSGRTCGDHVRRSALPLGVAREQRDDRVQVPAASPGGRRRPPA